MDLGQAQGVASRHRVRRLSPAEDAAKLRIARAIAQNTFKDRALQERLRLYLVNTFPDEPAINAFAASEGFLRAATGIVVARLTEKSPLDHPKHVSALVSALGSQVEQVAKERLLRLPEGSTIFHGLEHVLTSNTDDDTLSRSLLRRRMDMMRLELSQNLLTELDSGLMGFPNLTRTYGRTVQSDTFPDALRATLGRFGIDADLEQGTSSRPRTIVVTPWSWSSPTLNPALNDPLKTAMDFVVDQLNQADYPTQWKWRDP